MSEDTEAGERESRGCEWSAVLRDLDRFMIPFSLLRQAQTSVMGEASLRVNSIGRGGVTTAGIILVQRLSLRRQKRDGRDDCLDSHHLR